MRLQNMDAAGPPAAAAASAQDRREGPVAVNRPVVFATVALALFMMSVDSTIVATALHTLQQDLQTSVNWAGWTLTAYLLGFVVMLPVSGRLSDHFGRRRVFVASVLLFTLASLACGLANNIHLLIVLRALQAAGGAGFTPSATGIIVDRFGPARDKAVSLFGSIFPVGAMIGPIFGGLFVSYGSWRGIFFVNVPVGLAVLLLTLRFIPRDPAARPAHPRTRFDLPGVALLGGVLLALMLAASYVAEADARVTSPVLWGLVLLAAGCGLLFFRHVRSAAQPVVQPRFIYGAGFGAVNLANAIYAGVTLGGMALVPLYAANRYGIGALDAGTLLIAQGIAAAVVSTLATLAIRRTGYRLPLYFGSVSIAAGALLLALRPPSVVSPYLWLAVAAFIVGIGAGLVNPATRNAGLQLAPGDSSTLAALRSLSNQVGAIFTISLTTAVVNHAADPGSTQGWIYAGLALLLLVSVPMIRQIPEHYGAW